MEITARTFLQEMLTLEQYLRLMLFMLNCSIQVTAVLKGDIIIAEWRSLNKGSYSY